MTRTTRRILFYCAIAVFVAASYIILLYAQGYKYDFSQGKFIRSGAIYVKVNTSADIVVDGKQAATTSLLSNTASVGGLLPGVHTLSIQKADYSVWQKKVPITAGFVEDFTRVMLLPQVGQDKQSVKQEIHDLLYPAVSPSPLPSPTPSPTPTSKRTPKPTATASPSPLPTGPYYLDHGSLFVSTASGYIRLADNVIGAALSGDNQKLAWFSDGQIWVYWFSDTDYQPLHHAGDIALVARFPQSIKAAQWFRDHIALDASGLKVIEIDTRSGLNIINF